uniref:Uncharacterized protein n=1 Tax=Triticum urartu TaxID=4572 RepID=A0A8R7PYS1_TRIUA
MSLHFDGCPGACPCSSTPTASYPEVPLLPLRLAAKRHTTASMVACEGTRQSLQDIRLCSSY